MSLIVRRKIHEARLAEGWHEAVVKDVSAEFEVATSFGVRDQATLIFTVNEEEEIDLRLRCTLSLGKKSKLYGIITELTGREPGAEFDLETLIGLPCKVLVSHKEMESGDVWENVDKVKGLKKRQPARKTPEEVFIDQGTLPFDEEPTDVEIPF